MTKTPGYTAAAPARGLRRLISLKETRIQSCSCCGGFSTRGRGTAEVGLRDRPRRGELQASQGISSPPLRHAHITSKLQQSYVIRLALAGVLDGLTGRKPSGSRHVAKSDRKWDRFP